ncbi:MAG: NADP-dependent malic enzyme [Candidatus Paceibacterota bacterium]
MTQKKKIAKNKGENLKQRALKAHKRLEGKIAITPKGKLKTMSDLALWYTPGVAAVSSHLAKKKKETPDYTIKGNTIAVVSDGSAVLGLGNIGPEGALPVMEGKAMIFKAFAGVNAFPIVLNTQDKEEIIKTVKAIAPGFGGINLEDISSPRCFEIEERLKKELPIPVFHDDQHGTAIVVLAGLINAAKVTKRSMKDMRVVIVGAGAAGVAVAKILLRYGVKNIVVTDKEGIISKKRKNLNKAKEWLAQNTNKKSLDGGLSVAAEDADAIIGVSGPGNIKAHHVRSMNKDSIVFALANPTPEIMPEEAKKAGAAVIATGRSDFPNQINNALVFPGVFRGALDNRVRNITEAMKIQAALNLAHCVKKPTAEKIIPSIFAKQVVREVAKAIR